MTAKTEHSDGIVTIITRTRKRNIFLRRAIESVLSQTYEAWHHIIINDGGDPIAVEALMQDYLVDYDKRFELIHFEDARGMQFALNTGLQRAKTEFLAVHDDDDSWAPEFLEKTVGFLQEQGRTSKYQGVVAQTVKIIEDIDEGDRIVENKRLPHIPLDEINLFRIGYENPFPPIAFLYRKKIHDTVGYIEEKYDLVADMDFNIRFLCHFEIGLLHEPLAFYHVRESAHDPAFFNSVTAATTKHRQLFNELINNYLRHSDDETLRHVGQSLNHARYLVDIHWRVVEIFKLMTLEASGSSASEVEAVCDKILSRQFTLMKKQLTDHFDSKFEEFERNLNTQFQAVVEQMKK